MVLEVLMSVAFALPKDLRGALAADDLFTVFVFNQLPHFLF